MQTQPTGIRPGLRWLGVAALAALAWSVYEGVALGRLSTPLLTKAAPMRFITLQLASTPAHAREVLASWDCPATSADPATPTLCDVGRRALARDARFIAAYVVGWVLAALWAGLTTKVGWRWTTLAALAIVAAGLSDLAENALHLRALDGADTPGTFARARLAAMTKWALLLAGAAWTLAVGGGALRRILVSKQDSAATGANQAQAWQPLATFGDLIKRETTGIFQGARHRSPDDPVCQLHAAADEQFVSFRGADLIGLALSGGGIRSATFNLGFLQGLHRMRLLRLFDYLSTVSGGGYVGSFWSAWLVRSGATADLFPTADGAGSARPVDTEQERHLREFGGFLAPRVGFFEVEAWTAVVALLAGLIPALLMGLSVIAVALVVWLSLTFPLASGSALALPVAPAAISGAVLFLFERMWREFKRESAGNTVAPTAVEQAAARHARRNYLAFSVGAVALVVLLHAVLPTLYARGFEEGQWPIYRRASMTDFAAAGTWVQASAASGLGRWWDVTGIAIHDSRWLFSPRLFDYGLVWFTCGLLCLLARFAHAVRQWKAETLAAFDRVVMRILGMAVLWCGFAVLWHVAVNLEGLLAVATTAVAGAGVFAALRNWVGTALRRPTEVGLLDRLRPILPQALAYITLAATAVLVAGVLVTVCGTDWWKWWQATAASSGLLVLGLFLKTDEFGLHAFYRDRITRAYQGASNPESPAAANNRGTEPRETDKLRLSDLSSRPLHLVCCAANDLSGDKVETLGRGARSAVLSKYGIAIGRHAAGWRPWSRADNLGSAITASAAAFNSNMGQISARLGPVVSFLMTTLNLRLGLWVRHPAAQMAGPRAWPGLLYYREMAGLTSASGRIVGDDVPVMLRDLHLSDGGHFENLALYELVRRHCRYIIVSDCGADPTVAFDDLGNAIRRVREDFGVDITLDVSSLRPGDGGRSRQHVAVGTINYAPDDRGILLYVKPSLTGDEPPDVLQYRTRNTAFPHEGTGDQFYDEAQWESYRRLGLHAAQSTFDFVARGNGDGNETADWVFAEASRQWGTTPEGLEDRVLDMTKRFGALESELNARHATGLMSDVFPEIGSLPESAKAQYAAEVKSDPRPSEGAHASSADAAIAAELAFMLRVIQLMEDAWLTCELDQYWTHPLNLGWINLFARWATSSSFRFWWPLFAPMYSPGFQRFIQSRFPRRDNAPGAPSPVANTQLGRVEPVATMPPTGLAAIWWTERSAQPIPWLRPAPAGYDRTVYQNVLDVSRNTGDSVPMQVGLVGVLTAPGGTSVGWTSDDFFVPPSLWGAGIGWYFLARLLERVSATATYCHVIVKEPPEGLRHQVALDDRRAFIEQYKKTGFREARAGGHSGDAIPDPALCAAIGYDPAQDKVMVLNLVQWRGQRGLPPR